MYLRQRIKTDLKNHQLTLILFSTFSFSAVPIILHNKCALHYLNTNGNDNNIYEKVIHVHNYSFFWKGLYFNIMTLMLSFLKVIYYGWVSMNPNFYKNYYNINIT